MSIDPRMTQALDAAFAQHRSVFWHDLDAEFASTVERLAQVGQFRLVRVDQTPALQTKLDVETALAAGEDTRWLFYSNQPEPEPAHDWLLDIRLRSKAFRADGTSILLDELGLSSLTLAPRLKQRGKFFAAKDRVERLKRLVLPGDDAQVLDRKMLAVALRCDDADPLALAMRVLHSLWVPGEPRLAEAPKAWAELQTLELDGAFWDLMAGHLGYVQTEPSLPDLLRRVLVTDLAHGLGTSLPQALSHWLLPGAVLGANAAVLCGRWRGDLNLQPSYADLSAAVADALKLREQLSPLPLEVVAHGVTFLLLELLVVAALKRDVLSQGGAALAGVQAVVARRRDGPWVNARLAPSSRQTRALAACYDALEAAAAFHQLKEQHADGLSFADADDAVARYRSDLMRFDQLYRRFHHAADQVEPMGWAVLHDLREGIEQAYSGWFMPQLSSAWAAVMEGDAGLLARWRLADVPPQQSFFDHRVAVALGGSTGGGVKRVFVVISDALRYEVADELAREINGKNRLIAQLDAMLGVLPSYTSLGMAALLPHQQLAYRTKGDAIVDVLADGQPTATLEARNAVLARYGGLALKADELLSLGKEKGRTRVKDHRVVYVYHDRIDLLGDKQASEDQTFQAVADTVAELQSIVSFVVNNLNGSLVLVTADHGFVYQCAGLAEADKAALGDKPAGTLKAKKRYLLGRDLPEDTKAWRGNTAVTAGTEPGEGSLDFWVPKGTARFHFAGGARFVHGSAMPQEVLVPVLTVRESEAAAARTRQVGLSLLGSSNKVVTNTQRFEFMQSEPVSARVLARTVLVSLRDGQALISDEQSLTLDSPSASMDARVRSVILTVRSGSYDRLRDHYLVVRDAQSPSDELLRQPVRIDLVFSNDF